MRDFSILYIIDDLIINSYKETLHKYIGDVGYEILRKGTLNQKFVFNSFDMTALRKNMQKEISFNRKAITPKTVAFYTLSYFDEQVKDVIEHCKKYMEEEDEEDQTEEDKMRQQKNMASLYELSNQITITDEELLSNIEKHLNDKMLEVDKPKNPEYIKIMISPEIIEKAKRAYDEQMKLNK